MKKVLVWRVLYTSIARVRASTRAEAFDKTHIFAGQALKHAREITPSLADDVDIENIDLKDAVCWGEEEVPTLMAA